MKKFGIICIMLIFTANALFCEISPQVKQNLFKTYKKMARGGYAMEKALLNRLEQEFDRMEYTSDDRELVKIVIYLSEEGVIRKEFEENMVINDHMDIRMRAVRLLARFGGDDACQALCKLLCYEKNINVLTAIFDAFVDIRDNEQGSIMKATLTSYRNNPVPDHTYLLSLIHTLKYIVGENDHSYSEAIALLKEIIDREDVKKVVKNEAREEILILQRFREASKYY